MGNVTVAIFPHFSTEGQCCRQSFTEAKSRLRIKHYKYSMLFPSRLRVECDSREVFFEDPGEVLSWLERHDVPEGAA